MFAHGFGCDQGMWRYVVPAFTATHRVVLFDHVGAGGSDLSAWRPDRYRRLDGYAADIVEVLEANVLPRVPELVSGAGGLVLDLTGVTFFDSAGVRLADRLARTCSSGGVPFAVAATPGTPPARVLEIVGFGPPLVRADLDTAIGAVSTR